MLEVNVKVRVKVEFMMKDKELDRLALNHV